MQVKSLGVEIERDELRRGDLVFWKGHVGLMENEETLLHANGHTMNVARENLDAAIERIGWLYEKPTAYRLLRPEKGFHEIVPATPFVWRSPTAYIG